MNEPQVYMYPLPFEPPSHLPPHPTQIIYQLSQKGSPRIVDLFLLQWIFLTQESNCGLLHCRWILYQLSYQCMCVCINVCVCVCVCVCINKK